MCCRGVRWPEAGSPGATARTRNSPNPGAAARLPARYDMSSPDNQRKLDAADALGQLADDAGLSLIHLALAFVLQHPAVTAPIIGPRTLDHLKSQLGAAEVTLSTDILDKIDEIVPPGSTVSRADQGYQPPSLTDPFLAPPHRVTGQDGSLAGWHASITAVIDSSPGRAATTRTIAVSSPSARRRKAAAAPEAGPK